jgi:hypothetical protein
VKLTSYYPPGAWNFEVASEYLENLCTPGLILFYLLRCLYEYKKCAESMNMQVCFHVALLIVSPSKAVCTDGKMCTISSGVAVYTSHMCSYCLTLWT